MEPLNDRELKEALSQWRAPDAPASLERKVLPRESWWRWLLTGSIRVPVPVMIGAAAIALAVYLATREPSIAPPVEQRETVSLADFQPVKNVDVQIVRRSNEGN